MLPLRAPVAVGVNVTAIAQFPPAVTEPPHVLVCAKSPLAVMPPMVNVPLPLLDSVTVWAALVVCTFCVANVRLDADRLTVGLPFGWLEPPHAAWPLTTVNVSAASRPGAAYRRPIFSHACGDDIHPARAATQPND